MPIKGNSLYPFKWFYRPELVPLVRVVRAGGAEDYDFETLHSILAEIDPRHWSGIQSLLIEAKQNAELQLRDDAIIRDNRLSAYYQGWLNYADYVLANFESVRKGEQFGAIRTPPGDTTGEVR
jgi:hypothetical protein